MFVPLRLLVPESLRRRSIFDQLVKGLIRRPTADDSWEAVMERSDPTKVDEKQKSVPSEHESTTASPLKLLLKVETTSALPDVCDMKKSTSEGVAFNWHI